MCNPNETDEALEIYDCELVGGPWDGATMLFNGACPDYIAMTTDTPSLEVPGGRAYFHPHGEGHYCCEPQRVRNREDTEHVDYIDCMMRGLEEFNDAYRFVYVNRREDGVAFVNLLVRFVWTTEPMPTPEKEPPRAY